MSTRGVCNELDLFDCAAKFGLAETKSNQLDDQHQVQCGRCRFDVFSVTGSTLEMKRELERLNGITVSAYSMEQRVKRAFDGEEQTSLIFVWRVDLKRDV